MPEVVARAVQWVARGSLRVLTGLAAMALAFGASLAAPAPAAEATQPAAAPAITAPATAEPAEQEAEQPTQVEQPTQDDDAVDVQVGIPSTVYTGQSSETAARVESAPAAGFSAERASALGQRAPPRG